MDNVASCFRDIVEELNSKLNKKKDPNDPKSKDKKVTGPPIQSSLAVPQKKMGLVIGKQFI